MRAMWHQIRLRAVVKSIALPAFVFYVGWNLHWLARGILPPSIWQKLTGLPCPTTGLCRSLAAYAEGDLKDGFFYNPFTPIFLCLLVLSAALISHSHATDGRPRLPSLIGRAWLAALGIAWVCKFVLPSVYW